MVSLPCTADIDRYWLAFLTSCEHHCTAYVDCPSLLRVAILTLCSRQILASAELLSETTLDHSQASFLQTVQACGTSLVETVNHVLDFTKLSGNSKNGGVENVIHLSRYARFSHRCCQRVTNAVLPTVPQGQSHAACRGCDGGLLDRPPCADVHE